MARYAEDFARWLFPRGKKIGLGWHIGDIFGAPGKSLQVKLEGKFARYFRDWSTDDRGDCVALLMSVRCVDFASATQILRERYCPSVCPTRLPRHAVPIFDRKANFSQRTEPRDVKRVKLPPLEEGSRNDLLRLSEARNLAVDALKSPTSAATSGSSIRRRVARGLSLMRPGGTHKPGGLTGNRGHGTARKPGRFVAPAPHGRSACRKVSRFRRSRSAREDLIFFPHFITPSRATWRVAWHRCAS